MEITQANNPKTRVLRCDMRKECENPVTHLDEKGFIYCAEHGAIRGHHHRCRKLTASELDFIRSGKPLSKY